MMSCLKSILSILCLALPRIFRHRDAKRRVSIVEEVRTGDEDAVNARIEAWEKGLKAIALISFITFCGCVQTPPKLPPQTGTETRILRIEWQGTKGWFVPDARMETILLEMDELYEKQ